MGVDLAQARAAAQGLLAGAPEGEELSPLTAALVRLGVAAATTTLDLNGMQAASRDALDLGADADQVAETVVLVSALGMHTLHEGARQVAEVLRERGDERITAPLDAEQRALRASYVGDDAYWQRLEAELPGFLDALLRLAPEAFEAFFAYCAVPWRTRHLDALTKELIYVAVDATPTHRYLPGLRLHVANALRLGASATQLRAVLELAAASGEHAGIA